MKYFLKRVIGTIPVLLGVVLLIFIMLRIIPGSPVLVMLGEHYDQETIERLTELMGLDQPLLVQFFDYVKGALMGDLGISYRYQRPGADMIMDALPYTVKLAVMAALFAWVMGIVSGIIAAVIVVIIGAGVVSFIRKKNRPATATAEGAPIDEQPVEKSSTEKAAEAAAKAANMANDAATKATDAAKTAAFMAKEKANEFSKAFKDAQARQKAAEKIICPNCGTANDVGSKFCANCGTKLGDQ